MHKKYALFAVITVFGIIGSTVPLQAQTAQVEAAAIKPDRRSSIAQRLRGRIVLETERHGEAWYISPKGERYYIKDGNMAHAIITSFGGTAVSTDDITAYISGKKKIPAEWAAKTLIRKGANISDKTAYYYVCPKNLTIKPLDSATAAWNIVRECAIGISEKDINSIPIGKGK